MGFLTPILAEKSIKTQLIFQKTGFFNWFFHSGAMSSEKTLTVKKPVFFSFRVKNTEKKPKIDIFFPKLLFLAVFFRFTHSSYRNLLFCITKISNKPRFHLGPARTSSFADRPSVKKLGFFSIFPQKAKNHLFPPPTNQFASSAVCCSKHCGQIKNPAPRLESHLHIYF